MSAFPLWNGVATAPGQRRRAYRVPAPDLRTARFEIATLAAEEAHTQRTLVIVDPITKVEP